MRHLRGYYVSCRNPQTKQENAFINLGCIFVAIRDRLGSFRLLTHPVDPTHPQTWDAMVLAALGQSCGSSGSVFLCVWKALGCAWKAREGSIRRILCVWKALGGSKCRILRVWKLKTLKNISHLLGFGRPRAFESNPDPWFFAGSGALLST